MAINFTLHFKEKDKSFHMRFGEVVSGGNYPPYEGEYEVTPQIEAQTLETANKRMTDDLTVKAIPYYEVDNNHQGQTVIIGGN